MQTPPKSSDSKLLSCFVTVPILFSARHARWYLMVGRTKGGGDNLRCSRVTRTSHTSCTWLFLTRQCTSSCSAVATWQSQDMHPHYVHSHAHHLHLVYIASCQDETLRCMITDTKILSISTCTYATTTIPLSSPVRWLMGSLLSEHIFDDKYWQMCYISSMITMVKLYEQVY
jgi:hypothetical protein